MLKNQLQCAVWTSEMLSNGKDNIEKGGEGLRGRWIEFQGILQ